MCLGGVYVMVIMSVNESTISNGSFGGKEFDERKTEMLYDTLKQVSTGLGK
jgi:hypothetical protein